MDERIGNESRAQCRDRSNSQQAGQDQLGNFGERELLSVVKPQASLFERLGSQGWRSLERVIRYARAAGLLVLLDAKRGGQGASAGEAVRGFRRGQAGLEGGIVSSSRPILFPTTFSDVGAGNWEKDVRNALDKAANELGEAVL